MSDEKSVANEVQQLSSFSLCVPASNAGGRYRLLQIKRERVVVEPALYPLQVLGAIGRRKCGLDHRGQHVGERLLLE